MTDQLSPADQHMPEFTPDTIQQLMNVRKKMLDNAAAARAQEQAWMHRATQWDVFIRQAQKNAQPTEQAWKQAQGPTPCQICSADMWWLPISGFVHPLDNGTWEDAGDACKRLRPTQVLPAVDGGES